MSQTKVPTKESLQRRRVITISDLLVKADNEDWHGVADAAMDLREIDAMLDVFADIERRTFNYPTQQETQWANANYTRSHELAAPRLSDSAAAAVSATVGPERGKDSGTSLYDARTDRYLFADGSVDQSKNELLVGPR